MSTRLLIVDDDERICRMLGRYLIREGYQISTASDGFSMWETLKTYSHELIIMDIMLPGADGITLTRELKEKNPVIGVIMLTAKNDIIDTILGLEVGADDYITKPFDYRILLARVNSVLRRMSYNAIDKNNIPSIDNSIQLSHD